MNRRVFLASLAAGFWIPGSGYRVQNPNPKNPEPVTLNPLPDTLRIGMLRGHGGYTVEAVPLETYVARVLSGEAVRDSQPAALEALAITVRTFALANRSRHRGEGFDLCDQTHCQVVRVATPATERAAAATASRVLLRDGLPASIYFSASCGGRTEIPSAVWPGAEDPPFLPSRDDDACQGAPVWSADLEASDVLRALRASAFRGGRLREMRVASRSASGRVARLQLDGLEPDEISGQDLRVAVGRTLGWQYLKSTAFTLRRDGDVYRFNGRGSGHGVGLCVIGSARLAERGLSPEAILERYFPGLQLGPVKPIGLTARSDVPVRPVGQTRQSDRIVLMLPEGNEGERTALVRQVTAARDEIAKALAVSAPPRVTVRFHATTDDYERATGQPWFTSGAVVGPTLHLLPLAVLRERGVLDRTVRHELVHLMTDAALAGRAAWVREGAAIYFAGERPIPGRAVQRPAFRPEVRASCPTDHELLQPVSVGALAFAFARARACFVKQIEAGKSWRDVK